MCQSNGNDHHFMGWGEKQRNMLHHKT